jgi:hypothetical protein
MKQARDMADVSIVFARIMQAKIIWPYISEFIFEFKIIINFIALSGGTRNA